MKPKLENVKLKPETIMKLKILSAQRRQFMYEIMERLVDRAVREQERNRQ